MLTCGLLGWGGDLRLDDPVKELGCGDTTVRLVCNGQLRLAPHFVDSTTIAVAEFIPAGPSHPRPDLRCCRDNVLGVVCRG